MRRTFARYVSTTATATRRRRASAVPAASVLAQWGLCSSSSRWCERSRAISTNLDSNGVRIAVAMSGGIDSSVAAMLLKRHGYDVVGVYMRNWDVADELQAEDTRTCQDGDDDADAASMHRTRAMLCPADADLEDVREVCALLGINEVLEANFVKEYWNDVFAPFLERFEAGVDTPNADVACNRYVKFAALHRFVAKELGPQTLIATGHYARSAVVPKQLHHCTSGRVHMAPDILRQLEDDGSGQVLRAVVEARVLRRRAGAGAGAEAALAEGSGWWSSHRAALFTAADPTKDQTYFLGAIEESALRDYVFPVGHLTKAQVRALAAAEDSPLRNCRVLQKRESMGLCFIGKRPFDAFLGRYMRPTPGRLIDVDDAARSGGELPVRAAGAGLEAEHYRVLGRHEGMETLTLGQGAGVSGAKSRYFVCKKVCFRKPAPLHSPLNTNGGAAIGGGGGVGGAESLHNALQTDGHVLPPAPPTAPEASSVEKRSGASEARRPSMDSLVLQYGDVLVCSGSRHPALFCDYLVLRREDLHWLDPAAADAAANAASCPSPQRLFFKARYAQKIRPCRLEFISAPHYSGYGAPESFSAAESYNAACTHVLVHFEQQPERAITPGQVCVLYRELAPQDQAVAPSSAGSAAPTAPAAAPVMLECVGSARVHAAGPSYAETGKAVPAGIRDL